LNENLYKHQTRTKLLVERVRDEKARLWGRQLLVAGLLVSMAQSEAESESGIADVGEKISALNERIGEVIRDIDSEE